MIPIRPASIGIGVLFWAGCATSAWEPPREMSARGTPPGSETRLSRLFAADAAAHPGSSGVFLLDRGDWAYQARLDLVDFAEATLDAQYYIWQADGAGRLLMARLLDAADRGVRVRLLIDDLQVHGRDETIARLAAHPGVDVRAFNPFQNRSVLGIEFLSDFSRLNHRMHNKLLLADHAMAIVGGRNIGDNYFSADADSNFRDLDVLTIGPVATELAASFETYWTSPWAVPISGLSDHEPTEEELAALRQSVADALGEAAQHEELRPGGSADLIEAIRSEIRWAPARVVVDPPHKMVSKEARVSSDLAFLVDDAQSELSIEAAYFVLGPAGVERVRELVERGVRVRILTNSLATNDVVAAHAGYAESRKPLLEVGAELHELRPDSTERSRWSLLPAKSKASLHTKAVVMDRRVAFVGSFNLDPRSANINTEVGILVEDEAFAAQVAEFMDAGAQASESYQLSLGEDGDLVWTGTGGGGEVQEWRSEPEAGWWRRFSASVLGWLPIRSQL